MFNPYDKFDKKTLKLISNSQFRTDSNIFKLYLEFAKDSALKSKNAADSKNFSAEIKESATAIIFSVLACEAFLSEFIEYQEFASSEIPKPLLKLRKESDPLKKWKIALKFLQPDLKLGDIIIFQKFNCLLKLRNHISHRNSRLLKTNEYPTQLSNYMKQGIFPKPKEFRGSWILSLSNFKSAKWSSEIGETWILFAEDYFKFEDP